MARTVERFFRIKNYFWYNLLFWLLVAVLDVIQAFSFSETFGYNFESGSLIRWPLSIYISYWGLSLLAIRVYISTLKFKKWSFVGIHIVLSLLFGFVHKIAHPVVGLLLESLFLAEVSLQWNEIIALSLQTSYDFLSGSAMYWLMILIFQALNYYQKLQEKSNRAIELEGELSNAHLHSMKMQLQPHFLFNAFNTISMMVRNKKNDEAVHMISDLGEMLRQSLSRESQQFITLGEEIDLTRKYLNIESHRFSDRVSVEWEVDESLFDCKVPSLILQPIVENAFKHGISRSIDKEKLKISCQKESEKLILEVFNTGSELAPNWDFHKAKGIGLANTADRLSKLYNRDFKLLLNETPDGLSVKLQIPLNGTD